MPGKGGNNSKTSTKKKNKPPVEKTTVDSESDHVPDTDDIVTYDGDQDSERNIDLTKMSEASLQEAVDKSALELNATQLQLAPDRKKLFEEYLEVCKKKEQLIQQLSPLQSDYEIKRMNQMYGKHATLLSLPIGYMPANGLRGPLSLEDIHKKIKKDIINCLVAKNKATMQALLQESVADLKRHNVEFAKNSTRMITDAVQNVQAGTNLNVFKKVSRKPDFHREDLEAFWTYYVQQVYEKILAPDGIDNMIHKPCSNPACTINDGMIDAEVIKSLHADNNLPRTCYRCLGFFCHEECTKACRNAHDRNVGDDPYCVPNSKIGILSSLNFDKILAKRQEDRKSSLKSTSSSSSSSTSSSTLSSSTSSSSNEKPNSSRGRGRGKGQSRGRGGGYGNRTNWHGRGGKRIPKKRKYDDYDYNGYDDYNYE